ncbi:hypothetical protein BDB01DRAFT_776011 [Pilobolus umbonatus]|nr:hypothetical protein BDB01DRAFT_776011 [Pilobolus umbonatus]
MSLSIAEIYDDYLESLQNLPSELDQNMHELRRMDDDLQRYREVYKKHRRLHVKQFRTSNHPSMNVSISHLQIEKEYRNALQKQDQKVELAMKMYSLVSRHIERLDSQVAKSGLNELDWIEKKDKTSISWAGKEDNAPCKKRITTSMLSNHNIARKRIHHSSRPNLANTRINGGLGINPNEPTYCYCGQVSYGDMIACDGNHCEKEWFHYPCVGLTESPPGKWFCNECLADHNHKRSSNNANNYLY